MKLSSIKAQLKPKTLEGGLSEFYAGLKEKYVGDNNLTYIKNTPCVLGCMSIIRKLIKILSLQPGSLSNNKPKVFAPTDINKTILEPIISKEGLDWNVKVKNVKKDLNASNAVSLYNINRKLSYLVVYDLNIDEKALENYINYVNKEIVFLDGIINQTGGDKSSVTLNLDQTPSNFIINENNKRRELVRKVFNDTKLKNDEANLPNE
jgi:hypothetical protein